MLLTLPDSVSANRHGNCRSSGQLKFTTFGRIQAFAWGLASVLALALTVSTGLSAQTIYRCGNLYSQFPCEGAQTVDAKDNRSQQQKSHIDEATRKTRQAADGMEQARQREDKKQVEEQARIRRAETARLANLAADQKLAEAREKARLLKEKQVFTKGPKLRKTRSKVPAPEKPQP